MLPAYKIRIMVATEPVDFRKGRDGLALLVQSTIEVLTPFRTDLQLRYSVSDLPSVPPSLLLYDL